MLQRILLVCCLLFICVCVDAAYYSKQYSVQQILKVPSAGTTYGQTPPVLFGRGFQTLITGYVSPLLNDNGIYVHTADDGYDGYGYTVWTQQAKLKPAPETTGVQDLTKIDFGSWMVSTDFTILVSAPKYKSGSVLNAGAVYVFNGTLRHWSQLQVLVADDSEDGDRFGEVTSMHNDRAIISAKYAKAGMDLTGAQVEATAGKAYVFDRDPKSLKWSQQVKLTARDATVGYYFGKSVSVYDEIAIATAENDQFTSVDKLKGGSAYVFKTYSGQWSQQQKLVVDTAYVKGERTVVFGDDLSMHNYTLVLGNKNANAPKVNSDSVYVYQQYLYESFPYMSRWSLQQKLFKNNESGGEVIENVKAVINDNSIVATAYGPAATQVSYVFQTFGNGWSQQQRLTFEDETTIGSVHTAGIYGASLLYSVTDTTNNVEEVVVRTSYKNGSCLLIWLSDHYTDGWDTAVLTVRAPNLSNDTFHPHCDQIDPFKIRYCPRSNYDDGTYIIKVYGPLEARFYWEMNWKVMDEATGTWYLGDYSSKMFFNFNSKDNKFSYVSSENLIDLNAACYRCMTVATKNWLGLQDVSTQSFFPFKVTGAPYYISDYEGRRIYTYGKVCDGITTYSCQIILPEGVYILRVGGGLFGVDIGYPKSNAAWEGCGTRGTYQDQLIFRIVASECQVLQVQSYADRCARPPQVDVYLPSATMSPTAIGGTHEPTKNVFGPPYNDGGMY